MAHKVHYEWIVEQSDEHGDILETSACDTLEEARAFKPDAGMIVEIALRRDVGDDIDGLVDRQYAYPGDTEFEYGAAIPKRFAAQLSSLAGEAA